jgi:hypothetical protein
MQHKKLTKNRKNPLLIISVLFFASAFFLLKITNKTNPIKNSEKNDQQVTRPVNSIDYGPPTDEEANAGDEQKKIILEKESTNNIPSKTIDLVIVDASQYGSEIEIRAFVPNHTENGSCVFLFSKEGQQDIQKTMPATADASTTTCMTLTVPTSEYPVSGKWNLAITYTSSETIALAKQEVDINK